MMRGSKRLLSGELATSYGAKFIVASDDEYCHPRYFAEKSSADKCARTWKKNCPKVAVYIEDGEGRVYLP